MCWSAGRLINSEFSYTKRRLHRTSRDSYELHLFVHDVRLHSVTNSQVRIANRLSPLFTTRSGVRQGCVLAPALFCRAVDWVLQKSLLQAGVEISGDWFFDTDYADDIDR